MFITPRLFTIFALCFFDGYRNHLNISRLHGLKKIGSDLVSGKSKESKESKESKCDHSSETPVVTHSEEPVEIIAVEAKKTNKINLK